jgi:hypothetical protein
LQNPKERAKHATRMANTYLDTTSTLEINISHELIVAVKKEVAQLKTNPDYELPATLFDELMERGILVNLIDTYSRFFNSEMFKKFLEGLQKKRGITV